MMTHRNLPLLSVLAIAAVLWVVPSIVSQGMVTVGERFGHADQDLVVTGRTTGEVRAALLGADAQVEAVLADGRRYQPGADVVAIPRQVASRVD